MIRSLLSVLLVLLPAAYAGWSGRLLVRRLDDPLFPELHFHRTQRLSTVFLFALVAGLLVSAERAWLKFLLAAFALAAAQHGYRKRVFQETWTLFAYVGHYLRLIGLFGVWILIAIAPGLVLRSGAWAVPVAIALAAAILAASQLYVPLVRRLLGAAPVDRPDLLARFETVLERAECRRPAVLRAGPAGGFWLNALAVPSPYRPAVVLSDDLLASLGPREVTAVFAHEVAHLEKHLRGWRLLAGHLALGTFAAAALGLPFLLGPSTAGAGSFAALWPLAVILWLGLAAARSRRREHESDLRALELCGDAPALIDALTKIHVLSRQPRRWSAPSEARMTHPSLAQRLRAIREAAAAAEPGIDAAAREAAACGPATPEVPELAVFAADGSDRAAVLAADRVYWLAGVRSPADGEADPEALRRSAPDCRSILYSDLADLRLTVAGPRKRRLVATDRRGRSLRIPVRAADVPALQAALARVEPELPGTAPGMPQIVADRSTRSLWVRLLALPLMLLGFLPPSSGTLSVASLLVLVRPARPTLAAAGGVALAAALLGLGGLGAPPGGGTALFPAAVFLVAGVYLLALAARRYRARLAEPRWVAWGAPAVLGIFAALSAGGGLLRLAYPHPASQLHLWARQGPALVLLLVGLAAIYLAVRRLAARLTAALALLAAAALLVVASPWFRDRFGTDPLAAPVPPLAIAEPILEKVRELRLPENPRQLALSPSGRLAYSVDYPGIDPGPHGRRHGFEAELADGGFVSVAGAAAVAFVDDERLAALVVDGEGTVLRILRLAAAPAAELEIPLPALGDPRLRLGPGGERWEAVGTVGESREMVRLAGDLGGAFEETDRVALPAEDDDASIVVSYLSSAGRLLTVEQRYGLPDPLLGSDAGLLLAMMAGTASTSRLVTRDAAGPRVLADSSRTVRCFEPAFGQRELFCATADEPDAQLWSVDAERRRLDPVGTLPGVQHVGQAAADGRLLLASYGGPLLLVDPAAARAWRVDRQILAEPAVAEAPRPAGDRTPEWLGEEEVLGSLLSRFGPPAVALGSGLLAVAVHGREGSTVLVYRQPAEVGPPDA